MVLNYTLVGCPCSISTRKKKQLKAVPYPFWFIQVELVLACYSCLSASRIYNTFSISTCRTKIRQYSTSFLVHPGRSPCMILLCLIASRIYNMLSISYHTFFLVDKTQVIVKLKGSFESIRFHLHFSKL